jgi:tripartite-type tricarboxylate transporter receptor subunit TctC
MQLPRRTFLQFAATAAASVSLRQAARAEDAFPSRPVRLIVGFTPGSTRVAGIKG